MADHHHGEIRIGGQTTREQLDRMAQIEPLLEGLDPDTLTNTGRGEYGPEVRDGVLWLGHEQATYGEFWDLERYLREQGIAYDRHSSGYHEYYAEESSFRPGVGCITAPTTDDGTVLADAIEVLSYIERGLTEAELPPPDDGGDEGIILVLMRRGHPLPPFALAKGD